MSTASVSISVEEYKRDNPEIPIICIKGTCPCGRVSLREFQQESFTGVNKFCEACNAWVSRNPAGKFYGSQRFKTIHTCDKCGHKEQLLREAQGSDN